MSHPIRQDRKASITIDFATPASAVRWLHDAQEAGVLADEAGLFERDMLDETVGDSGVPGPNRFIVRRRGTRVHEVVLNERDPEAVRSA